MIERRSFDGGVRVSVLGVGCGRVGSISNPVPMREIKATLEAAVEAGINVFDTADIYGQGDSERTLSRLLRPYRDRMFVVTKVGGCYGRHSRIIRLSKPLLRMMVRSKPQARSAFMRARTAVVSHNFHPPDERSTARGTDWLSINLMDCCCTIPHSKHFITQRFTIFSANSCTAGG